MRHRIAKRKTIDQRVKVETREIRGGSIAVKVAFDLPRKKTLINKK
jgi:hypothetical protein